MTLRISALLVWTLAAAAAMFWGLRLMTPAQVLPERTQLVGMSPAVAGDLTRLLGAAAPVAAAEAAPPPDAASRFRLTGVVATRTDRDPQGAPAPGLAIISVDGKPPQAYRVGDVLDTDFRLASVGLRSARVGAAAGGGSFLLELPPPTPAATGVPMGVNAAPAPPGASGIPGGPGIAPVGGNVPPPNMPPQNGQMLPVGAMPPGTVPPPQGMDPSGQNRALTQ
jgi:general secretion pathway protein C